MAAEAPDPKPIDSPPPPATTDTISGDSLPTHQFNRLNKRKRSQRRHQPPGSSFSSDDQLTAQCLLILSRAAAAEPNIAHPCSLCKKSFASHRALGGHMAGHRKPLSSASGDRFSGASTGFVAGGKGGHRCSICFRTFPTGQVLGGHQRRNYDGAIGRGLGFDLNLPPVTELAGGVGWRC